MAAAAFALPIDGLRLLIRERSLWRLAAFPLLLSIAACLLTAILLVSHAAELRALTADWLPVVSADRWFEWLWIGPAWLLLTLARWLLFAAVAVACLLLALLLASLAAAPFHEALSRRVEALVTGRVVELAPSGWWATLRDAFRSVLEELRRLVFFLVVQAFIVLAGLVLPAGALLAPPAMVLLTMLFLPLEYASHVLDRRHVLRFRDKRRWLLDHGSAMLGFGAAGFLICLVPGLNFLAMPVLVAGGTLLALRHPPADSTARAAAPGPRVDPRPDRTGIAPPRESNRPATTCERGTDGT